VWITLTGVAGLGVLLAFLVSLVKCCKQLIMRRRTNRRELFEPEQELLEVSIASSKSFVSKLKLLVENYRLHFRK